LPPLDFTPIHPPRATTKPWLSWPHHALRLDSAAAPRAPPHSVSF
jgi:hypothetical protein